MPVGHDPRPARLGALATRQRMSGTHLNWHVAESLGLPPPGSASHRLRDRYAHITLSGTHFAGEWLRLTRSSLSRSLSLMDRARRSPERSGLVRSPVPRSYLRPNLHAPTPYERLRIAAMVDVVVAAAMRISMSDLRHILSECDHPRGDTDDKQPKGFWRVDRDKDPELRHTVLTLIAFCDLEAFFGRSPTIPWLDLLWNTRDPPG